MLLELAPHRGLIFNSVIWAEPKIRQWENHLENPSRSFLYIYRVGVCMSKFVYASQLDFSLLFFVRCISFRCVSSR